MIAYLQQQVEEERERRIAAETEWMNLEESQREHIENLSMRLCDMTKNWHEEVRNNKVLCDQAADHRLRIDALEADIERERRLVQELQEEHAADKVPPSFLSSSPFLSFFV